MSALKQARKVLSARMTDPKAKLFGISEDLRVIAAAFDELETRQREIACAVLCIDAAFPRMQQEPVFTPEQYVGLRAIAAK